MYLPQPAQGPTEGGGAGWVEPPAHRVPRGLASLGTRLRAQLPASQPGPCNHRSAPQGRGGRNWPGAQPRAGPGPRLSPHTYPECQPGLGTRAPPPARRSPTRATPGPCPPAQEPWGKGSSTQSQGGLGPGHPLQCSWVPASSSLSLKASSGQSGPHQSPILTAS